MDSDTLSIRDGLVARDPTVKTEQHIKVAVLLATYNGAQFVEPQIRSLKENTTPFTLHWLDDHSTDTTREIVRSTARSADIELAEWHQPRHLGLPLNFFQLVECVEADIYLFCDQDDIWQPGKIDATVNNLLADVASPVLCFSDTIIFRDSEPRTYQFASDIVGKAKITSAMQGPPTFGIFSPALPYGHTEGFTRGVREIYLRHKTIARTYAHMHDSWMYDITVASGTVRMLSNVPTSLWRRHEKSNSNSVGGPGRLGFIRRAWRTSQLFRQLVSRHAQGFLLAAPTLPPTQNLDRLLEFAQLISIIDRRLSPADLVRMSRRGAKLHWHSLRHQALFLVACLSTDASRSNVKDHRLQSLA